MDITITVATQLMIFIVFLFISLDRSCDDVCVTLPTSWMFEYSTPFFAQADVLRAIGERKAEPLKD